MKAEKEIFKLSKKLMEKLKEKKKQDEEIGRMNLYFGQIEMKK
jgi:hypothetical protein